MNNFRHIVVKSPRIKLLYLLFSILYLIFINPVNSYTREEDLAINCGTPSESTSIVANTTWIGDIDSEHFSLLEPQQKSQSSITVVSPQISGSIVPYGTARISHYEFTYSFHHVTSGPKFLRLHFHPASYPNFHRSKSLFSVKTGPYTLLKNFNASSFAQEEHDDDHKKIVLREYCINIEPGQNILNLTFTPNTTTRNDSYAFINGIEVLSLFKHHHLQYCNKHNNNSGFKHVAMVHEAIGTNNDSSLAPWPSPPQKTRSLLVAMVHAAISTSNDSPLAPSPSPPQKARSLLVLYCISAVIAFILFSVVFLLCVWARKIARTKHRAKMELELLYEESLTNPSKSIKLESGHSCRCFSIIEIRAATINFDDIFVVGVGGFGKVYKGYIDDDGTKAVAIKRFIPEYGVQGVQEFKTEVEMLSQLSHTHLVSLIGYCNDQDDMIIVYDFMANGTLRDHLYGTQNAPLSWNQRLEICIGAGLGLKYLHCGAKFKIIHRDVKTSNILLDDEFVAKVSDFGLSKIGPNEISKFHVSTEVKGSLGYLDPEYSKTKRLTHKSDVYSFGVVLLEVLCGRPPLMRKVEGPQRSIVEWARSCQSDGPDAVAQMVDPFIRGKIKPECLSKFVEMALNCVVHDGNQRPSMSDVVEGLELALQLQLQTSAE